MYCHGTAGSAAALRSLHVSRSGDFKWWQRTVVRAYEAENTSVAAIGPEGKVCPDRFV